MGNEQRLPPPKKQSGPNPQKLTAAVQRGTDFLIQHGQAEDGSFSSFAGCGVKHDWRKELLEELASRQQPNGSWVSANAQWMEGDPNLATAFALLALSHCRPDDKQGTNRAEKTNE